MRRPSWAFLFFFCALGLAGVSAHALNTYDTSPRQVAERKEHPWISAVGLLQKLVKTTVLRTHPQTFRTEEVSFWNPEGNCTGTLIAPNLVLTAAHCFYLNPNTGGPDTRSGIAAHFLIDLWGNYSSGRSLGLKIYESGFKTSRCTGDPLKSLTENIQKNAAPLATDIAVVKLQTNLSSQGGMPKVATEAQAKSLIKHGTKILIVGYPGDYPAGEYQGKAPVLSDGCIIKKVFNASNGKPLVFTHNCSIMKGNSGAAIITLVKGKPVIIGVMTMQFPKVENTPGISFFGMMFIPPSQKVTTHFKTFSHDHPNLAVSITQAFPLIQKAKAEK